MATTGQLVSAMRGFIGIREIPNGSNRSRIGVMFGWNGVPWCAETISVACRKVNVSWWTASTDQMEAWARAGKFKSRWLSRNSTPRPGDIAVWSFRGGSADHVSLVEVAMSDGRLTTIGGNESNSVRRAIRSRSGLRGFVRLPLTTGSIAPAPKPPTITPPRPVLVIGSHGAAVGEFQYKVNYTGQGGEPVPGDLVYGPVDKAACANFQKYWKLNADGVCGPKTWAVLDYAFALKVRFS